MRMQKILQVSVSSGMLSKLNQSSFRTLKSDKLLYKHK
jgi:hypothetical protein